MKIGIVVDNELNSDIRVLREIGILKEQGFEIFVLCYGFSGNLKNPDDRILLTRIRIPRKLRDILFFIFNTIPVYEWLWAFNIKKFILKNSIDFLHVHDLYMSGAGHSGIIKAGGNIPLILDLHENYPYTVTTYNWTKGFFRRLISRPEAWAGKEREYLGYADKIVVLSKDFRDILVKKYPEIKAEQFAILPNVPDLSQSEYNKWNIESPFNNCAPVLFYYGVIAERRGIFDALQVFTDLIKEDINVNFLLIGPVDKKDQAHFFDLINPDILADHIHYIPWIDSKEFPAYLSISDICLAPFHKNPQHESGVANKIYEYMLGGKPIIASNCKPQQELIQKQNCGLVFQNLREFYNEIIKLINDKPLREEMGRNGKKAVMTTYNSEIIREELVKLYKIRYL